MPRVEEWLAYADADVVCLQETKLADKAFPALTFQGLGYESVHAGQGQWNGVAILSRVGIEDVTVGFDARVGGETDIDDYTNGVLNEARLISANCGGIRVSSVYVPNGRSLDDPHYGAKLEWLHRLRMHCEVSGSNDRAMVVCGDFNIAPDDRDVWSTKAFEGSTHISDPERDRLREFEAGGFRDVFRDLYADAGLYTYWDYRAGDFHQHRGMRIDLVLATATVADQAVWAVVDRQARKGKLPSDHAPVIVDFAGFPR